MSTCRKVEKRKVRERGVEVRMERGMVMAQIPRIHLEAAHRDQVGEADEVVVVEEDEVVVKAAEVGEGEEGEQIRVVEDIRTLLGRGDMIKRCPGWGQYRAEGTHTLHNDHSSINITCNTNRAMNAPSLDQRAVLIYNVHAKWYVLQWCPLPLLPLDPTNMAWPWHYLG